MKGGNGNRVITGSYYVENTKISHGNNENPNKKS